VEEIVDIYNTNLRSLIYLHAPIQTKQITIRPNSQWYTTELRDAKRERRKAERRMRKTELTVDRLVYREKCSVVTRLLFK
jgi:hypothetical protein